MTQIKLSSQLITKTFNNFGEFLIEPLEWGQGITVGNSLRRTLLSDLNGFGITKLILNDSASEFDLILNSREDILEIILNLKEIVFAGFNSFKKTGINSVKGYIFSKGPKIITSNFLKLPKKTIKIININNYICTITNKTFLCLEIIIEFRKGYKKINLFNQNFNRKIIAVDTAFSPIKKVNYTIDLIYNNRGLLKESLNLKILTNGSITPIRGFSESIKSLITILYPIFKDLKIFKMINKKFYDKNYK